MTRNNINNHHAAPTSRDAAAQTDAFPAGNSDLAALIRAFDWSQTSLGPLAGWPPSLKLAVNMILPSPVPIVTLWGPDGIMIYNDAYAVFAGSRHPRLLGSKVLEGWPEVADFNQNVMAVGLSGGTLSYHDHHLVLYRMGVPEDVWLDLNYSPILDEHGTPVGVMAIVVETTGRVVEEQRRRAAEERFQLALEAGTVIGTWVWDVASDRFTADARFARFFSLDPEQAANGLPLSMVAEAIHPDDRPHIMELIARTIKVGGPYRAEYRVRQLDGSYRWIEANGHCELTGDGTPLRFPGVLIDIAQRKQAEAELQQSEARLRAIFDTLPVGIVFAEAPSGRITTGNAQVERILRHPVLPSPATDAYGEWVAYDADGRLVPIEEYPLYIAVTTGAVAERDFQYQRGDGTRAWIKVLGAPVRSADGQIMGGLITIIDIDREKRAEARQAFLLALGDRLRGLTDARDVMRAASEMLGRHLGAGRAGYGEIDSTGACLIVEHEWTDGRMQSFVGRHRLAGFGPDIMREFRAGRAVRLDDIMSDARTQDQDVAAAFEEIAMRAGISVPLIKGGRWVASIYAHATAAHHWTDEDESLMREVAERTWEAVERARAEERLRELNATLETEVAERTRERDRIWNVSQDLLGIADLDGVWRSINPAWRRTLGWTEDEVLGRTSAWMEHPDDHAATRAELQRLAAGRTTLQFENRFRHRDGSYRWFAWTAVMSDGLLYCVARDVTAEKERQAELARTQEQLRHAQKMEAIGQLTGGIAHDFNNMLTGIIAGLELLQRRVAAGRLDDIERYVTTATMSAKRAAALTHRLLAFSRRQSLDIRPTDVNALIASLEDLLRRTLGESTTFETLLADGLWPALTDANQLENALLNLCINARDAMPDGGRLTVETSNVHLGENYTRMLGDFAPGDYVLMSVSDTGTGMTPDVMARAFDPFFTTKPIGQGTGLGLSMIYGFVKQSGGHIRIYSEVGQGTTVKLYLPRHDAVIEAAPPDAHAAPHASAGECVLIVEDDPAVRMLILEVLDELGYQALEAGDAQAAIAQIEREPCIDLLITDVGLPGMNGRQLAEIARQRRPDLPVLFVTGYAEGATIRGGFLDSGMDMVSKPFDIDVLAAKIRAMLEQ
jgi:PAS domain S-box-containing protein